MISAKEALTFDFAREALAKPEEEVVITDDELVILDYIDSTIESAIYTKFDGNMIGLNVPADKANKAILLALKKRYEAGDWCMGTFAMKDDKDVIVSYQLVISPRIPR